MQPKFWHERWESDQLGFHQESVNAPLETHWHSLELPRDRGVFVPLCGKSLDMTWIREQGHPVIGVELSPIAIENFFDAVGIEATQTRHGELIRYSGGGYDLYCGDFFALEAPDLMDVGGVYERASIIALPPDMRSRYARKMIEILPCDASILLISIEYDQSKMNGPPHSVPPAEIEALFGAAFDIESLEAGEPSEPGPRFKERGLDFWREHVSLLSRRPEAARA